MFNGEHSHQRTGHVQFNKRTRGGVNDFLVRICGRVNQERFLVNNNFSVALYGRSNPPLTFRDYRS